MSLAKVTQAALGAGRRCERCECHVPTPDTFAGYCSNYLKARAECRWRICRKFEAGNNSSPGVTVLELVNVRPTIVTPLPRVRSRGRGLCCRTGW